MAGKKKALRSSARLNANKKASTSLKNIVNECSLVEPASPTSLVSEEASSTSGNLLDYYKVIESRGKYEDYEARKNKEKAQLAKELIHGGKANAEVSGPLLGMGENEMSLDLFSSSPIGAQIEPDPSVLIPARIVTRHVNPGDEQERGPDRLHGDLTRSGYVTSLSRKP